MRIYYFDAAWTTMMAAADTIITQRTHGNYDAIKGFEMKSYDDIDVNNRNINIKTESLKPNAYAIITDGRMPLTTDKKNLLANSKLIVCATMAGWLVDFDLL